MNSNLESGNKRGERGAFVWSHILAALTGIIGIFNWLSLSQLQRLVVVFSGLSVWVWRAIDIFTFLILGIIWLYLVYVSQDYYEKGFRDKKMLKRFSIITAIQVVVHFVTHLIITDLRIRYGV